MNIILIIVLSIIIIGGVGVGSYFLVKKLKHKSSGSGSGTTRVCPKNSKFPFLDKKTNKCISGDDHCNSLNPPQVYNSKSYECESCKSPTPYISNKKPYTCLSGDEHCKQQIPPQIFNNGSCIDGDEYCNTLDPPQVFDKKSVSCKPCKPNDIMITTSTPYTCSPGKEYCNKLRPPQDFDLTTQKCVYKKCKEKQADCPSTNIIYNPSPDVCECLTPNDYCKTISPSTPYNIPSPSTTIKCGNAKDLKNYCNSINEYYDTSSTSGKCMDAGYFCTSELEGTYSPAEGIEYDMGDKCYIESPSIICPKQINYYDNKEQKCVTSPIDDNANGCCFSKEGTRFPNIKQIEGIYAIEMIADSGFKYILSQNSGSDTNTNPQLIGSQDDTTGFNVGKDIYYNYWKIFKATSSSNMLYTNDDKPYILQNMQTGKYMTYNNTVPINLRVDDQPSKFYIEGNPFSIVNKDSAKIYFITDDGTQTKKHYLQISANPPNQVMTGDYGSALYFRQIPYELSSGSDNLPFFIQSQEDLITPSPAFCSKCNCKENCNDFSTFPCINNKQCNIINELKGTPSPAYCYKQNLTFDDTTNQCGSTTEIPDSSLSPSEKIQYMLNARQDNPKTKFECENYSNILGINDAQLPNWKWYDKTNISPSLSPVLEKLKIKQDPGICILESDTNSLCGLNQNNDCSLFASNSLKYCKDKNTDAETYSVCLDNPNTSPSTENIYPNNNVIKDTCNEGDQCVIPSQLCVNDDNNMMTCYNGSWTEYKNDPEKQLKNFTCDKNKDYIGYYNTTFNKYCSVSQGDSEGDIASFTDTYQPLKLTSESNSCDYQGTVGVFNDGQNDNLYYCKKVYDNVGNSSLQWIKQDNASVNLEGNTMKKTWNNLYTNKKSSSTESNNFESCVANVDNTCSSGVDNGNYRCNTINKSNVGVCGLSNCNLTQSPSPSDNICVDASKYIMNKETDKCIINRNLEQNVFKDNDKCNYKTQWICGGQYTGFQNTDPHPGEGTPGFISNIGVCKGQNTPNTFSPPQKLSNLEVYQSVNPLGRGANSASFSLKFNLNVLEEPYGKPFSNLKTATNECDNDPDCIGISQNTPGDHSGENSPFYKFKKLGGESPSDSVSQYVTKPGLSNNSIQKMGKYFDFTLKDEDKNWGGYPNTLQDPKDIGVKGYSTYEEALNSIISSPAEGNQELKYGDVTCVPTTESPSQFCKGKSNPYLMITKEGGKYYPDQKIISGSVNGQMGNPNDPNTTEWWNNTHGKPPGTPRGYGPSNISTCIRVPCYNNECCNEGNTNPKLSYIYPCNSPSCFNIREMVTNSN